MTMCLVVYASRYGSTREVAQAVAEGLGADISAAASFPDVRPYDLIVVGSPIYGGDYLSSVMRFIRVNRISLQERKAAAFITAAASWTINPGLTGDEDDMLFTQDDYARGLAELTGGHVVGFRGFGGRLVPEELDRQDFETLNWFHRHLMREPLKGFDLIKLEDAHRWGQ